VVSEDDPNRDLVIKRDEYAQAGIREYWVVDPQNRTVLVLTRDASSGQYVEAGRYAPDETARSVMLQGFTVDMNELFDRRQA
jgi:Uma2 family endonuclease